MNKFFCFLLFWGAMGFSEPIKVGVVLPLTGGLSSYGRNCLSGIKMAVDEVGGISLSVKDNEGNAGKTRGAIKKLSQEDVSVIIGPLTSENVTSVASYVDSINIPLIAPGATNPSVTKVSDLVFRLCYTDEFQGEVMARFASFILKKKRHAMLVNTGDVYSRGLADAFKEEAEKIGAQIVGVRSYSSGDTDFKVQLLEIARWGADCIFVPGYYEEVGLIIRQARELEIRVPILGGDGWDSPLLLDLAGIRSGVNYYCTHFFNKDPEVREFRDKYVRRFGLEPTSFSALGYDAIKLIDYLKLGEGVGIVSAISKVENFKGVTGVIDFSKGRDPMKSIVIVKMEGGLLSMEQKFVPMK